MKTSIDARPQENKFKIVKVVKDKQCMGNFAPVFFPGTDASSVSKINSLAQVHARNASNWNHTKKAFGLPLDKKKQKKERIGWSWSWKWRPLSETNLTWKYNPRLIRRQSDFNSKNIKTGSIFKKKKK